MIKPPRILCTDVRQDQADAKACDDFIRTHSRTVLPVPFPI
jgi:hypothetical protein